MPIKKDEECFLHYEYRLSRAPKWYRDSYKQYVSENPQKANPKALKIIETIEEELAKKKIPIYVSYDFEKDESASKLRV